MTEKKKTKKKPTKATKKKPEKEIKSYQIESELKKMYPKMSAGEIARKYGVSRGVILNQLKKFNIKIVTRTSPKAGQRRSDIDRSFHKKEYLEKQLKEGLTIHAIAKECGCGYMQVFYMIEKHGLTKLAQEMKAKKKIQKTKK